MENKARKAAENVVYDTMDALDPSNKMSDYYKTMFSKMNDAQFKTFISRKYPYRFQPRLFKIEPKMANIEKAAKVINIPLMEKINMPYLYENIDGVPVKSQDALVVPIHLKKMKQFITKKNSMSTDIDQRDMKSGALINADKNGQTSDREMESLAVMGLNSTITELSRPRADAMTSKSIMYNTVNTIGNVSLSELPLAPDEVLGKNLLNTYMLGAMLNSNLINKDGYLAVTLKDKARSVEREV